MGEVEAVVNLAQAHLRLPPREQVKEGVNEHGLPEGSREVKVGFF